MLKFRCLLVLVRILEGIHIESLNTCYPYNLLRRGLYYYTTILLLYYYCIENGSGNITELLGRWERKIEVQKPMMILDDVMLTLSDKMVNVMLTF